MQYDVEQNAQGSLTKFCIRLDLVMYIKNTAYHFELIFKHCMKNPVGKMIVPHHNLDCEKRRTPKELYVALL